MSPGDLKANLPLGSGCATMLCRSMTENGWFCEGGLFVKSLPYLIYKISYFLHLSLLVMFELLTFP